MTDTVELRIDGACTVVFEIQSRKADYVHFNIKFQFRELGASLPPVHGCSLSARDIKRLAEYSQTSLEEECSNGQGPFTAYDAFFTLEFLQGDAVRFMASYGPEHPFSLGTEGVISRSAVASFRDGWLSQLKGGP